LGEIHVRAATLLVAPRRDVLLATLIT